MMAAAAAVAKDLEAPKIWWLRSLEARVEEISGLEIPRGFWVEVKPRTQWDGGEHLLQEVIVGVVGVEV
nr:hypothetical protein CFP56_45001 [Quercus suber]